MASLHSSSMYEKAATSLHCNYYWLHSASLILSKSHGKYATHTHTQVFGVRFPTQASASRLVSISTCPQLTIMHHCLERQEFASLGFPSPSCRFPPLTGQRIAEASHVELEGAFPALREDLVQQRRHLDRPEPVATSFRLVTCGAVANFHAGGIT